MPWKEWEESNKKNEIETHSFSFQQLLGREEMKLNKTRKSQNLDLAVLLEINYLNFHPIVNNS